MRRSPPSATRATPLAPVTLPWPRWNALKPSAQGSASASWISNRCWRRRAMQLQLRNARLPRCLILRDGTESYVLMGGDPAIVKVGARVRVTGYLAVGMMSYCMQGKLFQVTSAQSL